MKASLFDALEKPACARHAGLDPCSKATTRRSGWAKMSFEARPEFLNPAGFVQGGFVTAMLDDSMGPAVMLATGGRSYTVTTNLNVKIS